ncbi:hypothetical protein Tco_0071978 [Tanacetum coccineum]
MNHSDALASKQPPVQKSLAWKTSDTREAPSSSSKQKSASPSEQPVDDVPIPYDVHLSDSEDTSEAHLLKVKTRPDWLKPLPKEEAPETPKPDWVIPPNDLPESKNNWADALAKTYKDPEENKLLQKTRDMGSFIIIPPRMKTQSADRPAATSRGGGTGGRASRGGGRTRGRSGDQGDGRINGQGGKQNGDAVNDNIRGNVSRGCTYKEFLACNPKEYDGKGGAIVYTRWIKKMESVHDMSGCRDSQRGRILPGPSHEMQKLETELWNHAMVRAGHAAYTDRFHELASLVPHLVTPESKKIKRYVYGLASQIREMVAAMEPKTMQKAV